MPQHSHHMKKDKAPFEKFIAFTNDSLSDLAKKISKEFDEFSIEPRKMKEREMKKYRGMKSYLIKARHRRKLK